MFVVIDMSDERKRIFEKYRKHEINLIRHNVKGCVPFFVAKCHKEYTDFDELRALVECYGVALFSDSAKIPQQLKDLSFEPEVLPLKMLVKTVESFLCQKGDGNNLSLCIVDPMAKCYDVVQGIVRKARYVRVVTNRCDRYELYVQQIYNSMGIKIDVTNDFSRINGSDIVVCVDDSVASGYDCKRIICFNNDCKSPASIALCKTEAAYPDFNSSLYGISPFRFLCALYETCGYQLQEIPLFEISRVLNDYCT